MAPRFLTMGEVLLILQDQVRRYGGQYGVRDPELLSSALAMPRATFQGKLPHEDAFDQAAAYAFHIYQNHPFVDGNKRTALAAALVFLDLNGVQLSDPDDRLCLGGQLQLLVMLSIPSSRPLYCERGCLLVFLVVLFAIARNRPATSKPALVKSGGVASPVASGAPWGGNSTRC